MINYVFFVQIIFIVKESQESLTNLYLNKAGTMENQRKKIILPMVYAKNDKGIKDSKKYGFGSNLNDPNKKNLKDNHHQMMSSIHQTNSRLSLMKFDKKGTMKYLDSLNIAKLSKTIPKSLSSSLSFSGQLGFRNMKHNPGEMDRQMRKAIVTLRMKKLSDIVNYNPTDNIVLQKQMKMMKSFSGAEIAALKKQTTNL